MAIDIGTAIATIGAGIAILGGAMATGLAQSAIGSAGIGMVSEKSEQTGIAILFLVLPETLVIFGFVIAFLILHGAGLV